jgi:flagellar hook protein FlgE
MSLYGAIAIGVSGLDANSTALSTTASNIANLNTVGYKTDDSEFASLVDNSGSTNSDDAGVEVDTQQNVSQQGLLSSTSVPTDLAISGNGMFAVSPTSVTGSSPTNILYTRAGNFTPDSNGNLVNSSGNYLLGWPLDSAGNPPTNSSSLSMVNVSTLKGEAEATQNVTLQGNLQASDTADATYVSGDMTNGTVTPQFQTTVNVYDSQGGTEPVQLSFVKTGANTWAYEADYEGPAANIGGATNNPIASGTMTFNSDGTLANANTASATPTGTINLTIPFTAASGLSSQSIALNMGTVGGATGFTQFDSTSALASSHVDGASFGTVTGVTIGTNGVVTAQFSNGLSQNVYEIPLATFPNVDGLQAVSGNAYSATNSSGTPVLTAADASGAGAIQSGNLEDSTVDLSTEFTNLITTQRAYEASSRIITTASTMLDNLLQVQ